jgi:hypothetical protein
MQRWTEVGFASAQAELLSQLVTRDYFDQRLNQFDQRLNQFDQRLDRFEQRLDDFGQRLDDFVTRDQLDQRLGRFVTRDYLDQRLRDEFGLHKRGMLMWMVGMQAPVYAALIYILMKLGV